MSNRITTEHRGERLAYDEDHDVWECEALGLSAKTLSALKRKIDDVEKDERHLGGLSVLKLDYSGWTEKRATLLTEDRRAVYCTAVKGGQRSKERLDDVAILNPETVRLVREWREAEKAAGEARSAAERAKAAIPRATAEQLLTLAKETGLADH